MYKRSAMMVAAGLVFTLVVGGVAVAVGMVGPSTSAASPRTVRRQEQTKPIVKTMKRTVKVHRSGGVVAVPVSGGTSGSTSDPQGSGSNGSSSDDNQDQVGQNQSGEQTGSQTDDETGDETGDDETDNETDDEGTSGDETGDDGSSGGDD